MFRVFFRRSPGARPAQACGTAAPFRTAETRPPLEFAPRPWSSRVGDWLAASGWRLAGNDLTPPFGDRARVERVAAARLDFADALWDVRTSAAAVALDRIAVARSLHELWHLRGEVFAHVARRESQDEAGRRLALLDRHFGKSAGRHRRRGRADADGANA